MNYKISLQSFGIRLDYIITRHVRYSNLHCIQLCAVQKGLLTTKSLSLISMEATGHGDRQSDHHCTVGIWILDVEKSLDTFPLIGSSLYNGDLKNVPQWGSEYRKHFNTKLFEAQILNGQSSLGLGFLIQSSGKDAGMWRHFVYS